MLEKLQVTRASLQQELEAAQLEVAPMDDYVNLESLSKFTEGLRRQLDKGDTDGELQAAIIRKVVQKIDVLPDGYEIFFHVGMNHYRAGLGIIPGSAPFSIGDRDNKKRPASAPTRGMRRPAFLASGEKNISGSTFFLSGGG